METKAIFANSFTNKVITNIKISGNETASKKDGDDDENIDLITDKARSFLGIEEIGDNVSFTNEVFEGLMRKAGWYEGKIARQRSIRGAAFRAKALVNAPGSAAT